MPQIITTPWTFTMLYFLVLSRLHNFATICTFILTQWSYGRTARGPTKRWYFEFRDAKPCCALQTLITKWLPASSAIVELHFFWFSFPSYISRTFGMSNGRSCSLAACTAAGNFFLAAMAMEFPCLFGCTKSRKSQQVPDSWKKTFHKKKGELRAILKMTKIQMARGHQWHPTWVPSHPTRLSSHPHVVATLSSALYNPWTPTRLQPCTQNPNPTHKKRHPKATKTVTVN
jgi:hypothetical protein